MKVVLDNYNNLPADILDKHREEMRIRPIATEWYAGCGNFHLAPATFAGPKWQKATGNATGRKTTKREKPL